MYLSSMSLFPNCLRPGVQFHGHHRGALNIIIIIIIITNKFTKKKACNVMILLEYSNIAPFLTLSNAYVRFPYNFWIIHFHLSSIFGIEYTERSMNAKITIAIYN